jgi:hypothetical protein
MTQTLSDDEFVELWMKCEGHAAKMAKVTKTGERQIYRRRNSIEARRGIALPSGSNSTTGRPKEYVTKIGHRVTLDNFSGSVMIGSDGHFWPGERSVAFDAFIKLIPILNPKAIVMGGDSFDGSRISRHPPGGWAALPEVADEIAAVQERHAEIEAIAPDGCPLLWPAGNHDSRFGAKLAQNAPEYLRVKGTDLADHFPSWQFCWSIFINDHTVLKHRWHQGVHAAYNSVLKSGKNIVTGHTHRLQATQFGDYNGIRFGIETGTLSAWGPESDKYAYAEDNPVNWSQGFVVLTFAENGMLLEPEFCRVFKGYAYFRGARIP